MTSIKNTSGNVNWNSNAKITYLRITNEEKVCP